MLTLRTLELSKEAAANSMRGSERKQGTALKGGGRRSPPTIAAAPRPRKSDQSENDYENRYDCNSTGNHSEVAAAHELAIAHVLLPLGDLQAQHFCPAKRASQWCASEPSAATSL